MWVSLVLALVIHGCNVVKRSRTRHSLLSPALLHRKMLQSANFSSMEAIARAGLRKRTRSKQTMSARSIARGDAVDDPVGDEIDPRYGVEKRLVPTGPNPLHH
ncbi:CLAVATA3/ESR protein [Nymphaea thermarum]|nr:CLAVATA3/ESR protein [Nymphaea thermarum]